MTAALDRSASSRLNLCLLLLTMTRVAAHPQRTGDAPNETRSTLTSGEISGLVQRAYANGVLLDEQSWSNAHTRDHRSGGGQRYQTTQTGPTGNRKPDESHSHSAERRLFGNSGQRDPMTSDGKIVFPSDDDGVHIAHRVNPPSAPKCKGKTFCEDVAYYPKDLVNAAMALNDSLRYLAGEDEVSLIAERVETDNEVPLCVSTEQVVYPKSAENKRNEWLFVVNQENFKQGIRIETCMNENGECRFIDGLPEGYRTTCKQKYIYRQLAAVSSDGKLAPDSFRFPSSCCCHITFTGDALTRIGLNFGELRNQTPAPSIRRRK